MSRDPIQLPDGSKVSGFVAIRTCCICAKLLLFANIEALILDNSTDEQPIVTSQRIRVDVKDGLLMLSITNVVLEDAGEYRILVRNQASEITTSCTVSVYDKIQKTETQPLFTNTIKGRDSSIDFIAIV